jgi:hypothetical protein
MELSGAIVGTLIGLVILALVLAATLCVVAWEQMRLINRMGDKLVSNSDYQIERLRIENMAAASPRPAIVDPRLNGFAEPVDEDAVIVPGRG